MKFKTLLSIVILTLVLGSNYVFGATIQVPGDQSTIQAAIDAAVDGDTVLVAPGTYNEEISFYGKNIIVRSKRGPAITIIEDLISFDGGATQNAILKGFTVVGGTDIYRSSPTIINCELIGVGSGANGGHGSIMQSSFPTFIDCKIRGGDVQIGGGFDIRADSSASFINCKFYHNEAGLEGGALHIDNSSSANLMGCRFWRNSSGKNGGAIYNEGGKVVIFSSSIWRNKAGDNGGGIWNDGSLTLIRSHVFKNKAGNDGGGVYNSGSIYKDKTIIKHNNPNNIYEP